MFTSNLSIAKVAWITLIALAPPLFRSQTQDAQKPVPITEEPHHLLVLENSYVRVFRFSLPGHEATLLHLHDLPYVSVSLSPTDFVNAVVGKPETHVTMAEGQVGYSRGGFAHLVRTDQGTALNDLTIELLHPQGEPRNLCQKITDGPLNDCPPGNVDKLPTDSPLRQIAQAMRVARLFETDEISVTSFSIALKQNYSESGPQSARLLVVEQNSELQVNRPGEPSKALRGGEVEWLEAGKNWTVVTPGDHKGTRFLLIRFKDSEGPSKP
ncbi:MAG TPA: hypothetical protein VEI54_04400 [Candidatus Limnocylindrales bacterium]|nr:hypothetical protein [Candidatus Limnocylindrales bacterium]